MNSVCLDKYTLLAGHLGVAYIRIERETGYEERRWMAYRLSRQKAKRTRWVSQVREEAISYVSQYSRPLDPETVQSTSPPLARHADVV